MYSESSESSYVPHGFTSKDCEKINAAFKKFLEEFDKFIEANKFNEANEECNTNKSLELPPELNELKKKAHDIFIGNFKELNRDMPTLSFLHQLSNMQEPVKSLIQQLDEDDKQDLRGMKVTFPCCIRLTSLESDFKKQYKIAKIPELSGITNPKDETIKQITKKQVEYINKHKGKFISYLGALADLYDEFINYEGPDDYYKGENNKTRYQRLCEYNDFFKAHLADEQELEKDYTDIAGDFEKIISGKLTFFYLSPVSIIKRFLPPSRPSNDLKDVQNQIQGQVEHIINVNIRARESSDSKLTDKSENNEKLHISKTQSSKDKDVKDVQMKSTKADSESDAEFKEFIKLLPKASGKSKTQSSKSKNVKDVQMKSTELDPKSEAEFKEFIKSLPKASEKSKTQSSDSPKPSKRSKPPKKLFKPPKPYEHFKPPKPAESPKPAEPSKSPKPAEPFYNMLTGFTSKEGEELRTAFWECKKAHYICEKHYNFETSERLSESTKKAHDIFIDNVNRLSSDTCTNFLRRLSNMQEPVKSLVQQLDDYDMRYFRGMKVTYSCIRLTKLESDFKELYCITDVPEVSSITDPKDETIKQIIEKQVEFINDNWHEITAHVYMLSRLYEQFTYSNVPDEYTGESNMKRYIQLIIYNDDFHKYAADERELKKDYTDLAENFEKSISGKLKFFDLKLMPIVDRFRSSSYSHKTIKDVKNRVWARIRSRIQRQNQGQNENINSIYECEEESSDSKLTDKCESDEDNENSKVQLLEIRVVEVEKVEANLKVNEAIKPLDIKIPESNENPKVQLLEISSVKSNETIKQPLYIKIPIKSGNSKAQSPENKDVKAEKTEEESKRNKFIELLKNKASGNNGKPKSSAPENNGKPKSSAPENNGVKIEINKNSEKPKILFLKKT